MWELAEEYAEIGYERPFYTYLLINWLFYLAGLTKTKKWSCIKDSLLDDASDDPSHKEMYSHFKTYELHWFIKKISLSVFVT